MALRIAGSIIVGSLLGLIGSRWLFVGSWISLVPWAIFGLGVGVISWKREWILSGGLYGIALAFTFMLAGYAGADPIIGKVPFFAVLGLFGAACGIVLALAGNMVRRRFFPRTSEKRG